MSRHLLAVSLSLITLAGCEASRDGLPKPTDSTRPDASTGRGGAGGGDSPATGGSPVGTGGSPAMDGGPDLKPDVTSVPDGPTSERPPPVDGCNFGYFLAKPVQPEVLLVFDRSSAMRKPAMGSTNTRWVEMTEGVTEALTKQASTSWGLKLFPSTMGCLVNDGADVAVGPGRFNDIINKIRGSMPAPAPAMMPMVDEGAPIAQGVAAALQSFPPSERPRFLVLASDGNPGCPPPALSEAAVRGAYDAVKNAVTNHVRTFVIGTAAPNTRQHMVLNELAIAGREANPGTTRYSLAQNKEQMVKALSSITDQLNSCLLEITPTPPVPKNVAMDIGGVRVPRDENQLEGWNYGPDYKANTKSVRVYGTACAKLRATPAAPVQMIYGCPGVTP